MANICEENAGEVLALIAEDESLKDVKIEKREIPRIINCILFCDKSCLRKLKMRKNELLKVRQILIDRKHPLKKPAISSELYLCGDNRYYTNFREEDVISYRIESGKLKDKYVVLLVDYLRSFKNIKCDDKRLVETREEFLVYDKLFDTPPASVPIPKFRMFGEKDGHLISHIEFGIGKKEYKSLNAVKIGTANTPHYEKYYLEKFFLGTQTKACGINVYSIEDFEKELNKLFE